MKNIAYVGMDVHQIEIRIAAVDDETGQLVSEHLVSNTESGGVVEDRPRQDGPPTPD